MHICVLVVVITSKCVHNGAWLLRCGRAIKINQRMTMRLLAENREILADGAPVHHAGSNLVHTIVCSTHCRAPLYSDTKTQPNAWWPGTEAERCAVSESNLSRLNSLSLILSRPPPRKCALGRFRNPSGHPSSQSSGRIARNLLFA